MAASRLYRTTRTSAAQVAVNRKLTMKQFLGLTFGIVDCLSVSIGMATEPTHLPTSSQTLHVLGFSCLLLLIYMGHRRSIRPSSIITAYLSLVMGIDALALVYYRYQLRLLHCVLALLLLLAESHNKSSCLQYTDSLPAPYTLAGTLDRLFFVWINPILRQGSRKSQIEAPPLIPRLSPVSIRKAALRVYLKNGRISCRILPTMNSDQKMLGAIIPALMRAQVKVLFWDFVAPIPGRLILIACRYAQPAVITSTIELVSTTSKSDRQEKSAGIIFWAIFTYFGMVVSLSQQAS